MTLDLTAEEDLILERLRILAGGRFYDFIPDDAILERDANQDIKPYATVMFGEPIPAAGDRSIMDEEEQPYVWPVFITCIGKNAADTRALGNAVRALMIGWHPSDNTSGFRGRGGGSFADRDGAARPTRSQRLVSLEAHTNLST